MDFLQFQRDFLPQGKLQEDFIHNFSKPFLKLQRSNASSGS